MANRAEVVDPMPAPRAQARVDRTVAAVFVAVTAAGLLWYAPHAVGAILVDSLTALVITSGPMLAGIWLISLASSNRLGLRWTLVGGAGLGLGVFSLLVLLLGLAGWLSRNVCLAACVMGGALGVLRLRSLIRENRHPPAASGQESAARWHNENEVHGSRYVSLLWLLVVPFFVLALVAASNAPGILWSEEGFGYDVLEYHLQVPREYRQTGRITYLPHNVYANFPSNVEMLYLLAMELLDEDVEIGAVAQAIHLLLGALCAAAAWLIGREWSRWAGTVAGVCCATCGWFAYLSGLAYVEHGLLLFGLLSTGCVLKAMRADSDGAERRGWWCALGGAFAGLACGCKYTAVPMIAFPLLLVLALFTSADGRTRIRHALLFSVASAIAFSPWLFKNLDMTGNPVFPLASSVFTAKPPGWGAEEQARWNAGHQASGNDAGVVGRLSALWTKVLADRYARIGPGVIALALLGLGKRRLERGDFALVLLLAIQLLVWLAATHVYARFAVVCLIPLALLAGRCAGAPVSALRSRVVVGAVIVAAVFNLLRAVPLHATESPGGIPASAFLRGDVPGYEFLGAVNHDLDAGAKVMMVGEAKAFYIQRSTEYAVVFNRNPFVEKVRTATSSREIIDWFRDRRVTHVLVNWLEVDRLRRTYGFADEIRPQLFDELERAGLRKIRAFDLAGRNARYVELFEVPPP